MEGCLFCILTQPCLYIFAHRGNKLMCRIITSELYIRRAKSESFFVVRHAFRRIKLVALSRQMKDTSVSRLIGFARLPVTWKTATDSYHAAKTFGVGESKSIVKRACLGEPE